jgi:hypothetical protein
VKLAAITLALVPRRYEQRPDVSGLGIADGKSDNLTVNLGDPTTTSLMNCDDVVLFRQCH